MVSSELTSLEQSGSSQWRSAAWKAVDIRLATNTSPLIFMMCESRSLPLPRVPTPLMGAVDTQAFGI